MNYDVEGEVTFKYRIKISAAVDQEAIDMAVTCALTGAKPSCNGLEYLEITKITTQSVEPNYDNDN